MSYIITAALKSAANNIQKTPNIIIEFDSVNKLFSLVKDRRTLRFDEGYLFDSEGLFFDTKAINKDTLPYILKDGTTRELTQQLNQDKGGSGSVPSINIALLDKNNEVSELLGLSQMLGEKVKVYLSFAELEHPVDSIRIFSGIVSDVSYPAGEIRFKIDNSDSLKRQDIFIKYSSVLASDITDTDTTLPIETKIGLLGSKGQVETHVRINDEIMRVNMLGGVDTQISSVTRGALGTTATAHSEGDEVVSIYRMYGNPLELALYIMMSGQDLEPYYESEILSFISGPDGDVQNAIFINEFNIAESQGVVIGSTVTLAGTTSKDGEYPVIDIGVTSSNTSYVVLGDIFLTENDYVENCTASFKTQFNKLNDGCKMTPDEVDIEQHLFINALFGSQFPTMEFLLDDTINAKEFIEKELYFPVGAYFLGRKGRASVGFTSPPLAGESAVLLNETNVIKPLTIEPRRSTNGNFYNYVSVDYGYNLIADKFTRRTNTISAESLNEIRTGNKGFTVESKGLTSSTSTSNYIDIFSRRILDRYKFGATSLKVQTTYGAGFAVEVGDTVILDGKNLKIYDDKTGKRNTFERLMEVQNKSMNIIDGTVTLNLLDTAYGLSGRYATISPSSTIETGTTTQLKILPSQSLSFTDKEWQKWERYFGQTVQIRNDDFTYNETTTLIGVDSADTNFLIVDALPSLPPANAVIELPPYVSSTTFEKKLHCYYSATIEIVSGIDEYNFTVSAPNALKLFVGAVIVINNDDYSDHSNNLTVSDITGETITVSEAIGFVPDSSHFINGGGFVSDNGESYLYL